MPEEYKSDKYQTEVLKTWWGTTTECKERLSNSEVSLELIHAALGLVGEAGEFADLVKKLAFKEGKVYDRDKLIDELGDVWYYLVVLTSVLDISVDELAKLNRDKLSGGKHGWKENK